MVDVFFGSALCLSVSLSLNWAESYSRSLKYFVLFKFNDDPNHFALDWFFNPRKYIFEQINKIRKIP